MYKTGYHHTKQKKPDLDIQFFAWFGSTQHLDFRTTTTTIWKQKGDYLGEKRGESVGGERRAKKADVIKIHCTHLWRGYKVTNYSVQLSYANEKGSGSYIRISAMVTGIWGIPHVKVFRPHTLLTGSKQIDLLKLKEIQSPCDRRMSSVAMRGREPGISLNSGEVNNFQGWQAVKGNPGR